MDLGKKFQAICISRYRSKIICTMEMCTSRHDAFYLSNKYPSALELLKVTADPKVILALNFLLGMDLYLDMWLGSYFQTRILCLLNNQHWMRKVVRSSKLETWQHWSLWYYVEVCYQKEKRMTCLEL